MPRLKDLPSVLTDLPDVEFRWREPLARYTTFRVGGPVLCLARPSTEEALAGLMEVVRAHRLPFLVLGGGSNLLLPDEELKAVAIQLDRCSGGMMLKREANGAAGQISVGAGVRLSRLLRFGLQQGWGGLEFLVGIPGTVGGALVMNAGTRDGCLADALLWLEVLDEHNRRRRLVRRDLSPRYRSMGLSAEWVVVGCGLSISSRSPTDQRVRLSQLMRERKRSQPLSWPSAGCIFKNPAGHAAGVLIEKAGLKGLRIGDAEVSTLHANWIINRGRASSRDIRALIETIEERVEQDSGIRLEREIRIVSS